MKQFLITLAAVFTALVLFFVGLPFLVLASLAASAKPPPPPAHALLTLDLRQTLTDQDAGNPFAFFQGRGLSVVSAVETLRRAAADPRVRGLFIRLPEGGLSPASADELREAILEFRRSGKPALAFSQGLYPSGISTAAYMLGTASGQFWMQPGASLQSVGIAREETFFKRFFDKYGVVADYQQRYEYKNAVNPFLYDNYTPAHREAELGWMTSVFDSEIAQAASDRKSPPASLETRLAAGPYSAEEAVSKGLIDRAGEEHDAEAALRSQTDQDAKFVDLAAYRNAAAARTVVPTALPRFALIGAEGDIVTGTSKSAGLGSSNNVYSDDVAKAFYDAAADRTVKAIVFRVSSPGGSDTASEQILAALSAAKTAGKPVVVSMGTYAASGGYWISSAASEIVADPSTLTGSIGVFGGKFAIGPALARFGVDTRTLSVGGEFASAYGSGAPFTPAQRAEVSKWMDRIYETFVQRVALGRRLAPDRVRQIAKGRVWTGVQAQGLGLVDKVGGFSLAVAEAKRLAGVPLNQKVRLVAFPARQSPFELLQHAAGVSAVSLKTLAAAAWILGDPRAQGVMDDLMRARLGADGSAVLAPSPVGP